MNTRLAELTRRREELVARSAAQREQLARCLDRIQVPWKLLNIGVSAVHLIRQHPSVFMGVTSFLASRRGGRIKKTAGRLLLCWQIFRPLRQWWIRQRQ